MSSHLHLPLCIANLLLLFLHVSYVKFSRLLSDPHFPDPLLLTSALWSRTPLWTVPLYPLFHFPPPLKCIIPETPYSFKDSLCAPYFSNWGLHGTVSVSSKTPIWTLGTSNKIVGECWSNLKVNSHLTVLIKSYPKWKKPSSPISKGNYW